MREIKFRAWDGNQMIKPFGIGQHKYDIGPAKWLDVMQYTGLKDKNGENKYQGLEKAIALEKATASKEKRLTFELEKLSAQVSHLKQLINELRDRLRPVLEMSNQKIGRPECETSKGGEVGTISEAIYIENEEIKLLQEEVEDILRTLEF